MDVCIYYIDSFTNELDSKIYHDKSTKKTVFLHVLKEMIGAHYLPRKTPFATMQMCCG